MDIYTVHQNSQSPVNMLVWSLLKLAPTIPSSKDCIKHAKMIQHTLVKHFSIASSPLQIVDVADMKLFFFCNYPYRPTPLPCHTSTKSLLTGICH